MEQDIYLEQIHLDRAPLRHSVTEESVAQLAEDIKSRGLLQAIVVRARDGGGWRLVAGRRRLTAARMLGWITIPARIIEGSELDEIDGLAENVMRLQMNPVEEAEAIRHLHEEKNLSIAEICERTNHGTSWVQDRLAICSLPQSFKDAISHKHLSISAALLLMRIHAQEYRDYLLHVACVNGATVHQVEAWLLDYQARTQLTNPTGQSGPIPQPPMRAGEPEGLCLFCESSHPFSTLHLIRVCPSCNMEIYEAKRRPPAPEPPPGASSADPFPPPETPLPFPCTSP